MINKVKESDTKEKNEK